MEKITESKEGDNRSEARKTEYRRIIGLAEGQDPDLILALDAGVAERKVLGESEFSPTSYEDETGNFSDAAASDEEKYNLRETSRGNLLVGAGGGKARVLAVRDLAEAFQDANIVTDSQFSVQASNHPEFPENHSEIYKEYLERMGIASDRIKQEKESTTTFEGLINFLMIAMNGGNKRLVVVTNEYHLPRTEKILELLADKEKIQKLKYVIARMPEEYKNKMGAKIERNDAGEVSLSFESDSFFEKLKGISLHVAPAENILILNDPHYRALIERAKQTEAYRKRVDSEKRGILQLEEGIYGKQRKE